MKNLLFAFVSLFMGGMMQSCSSKKDKPAPPPPVIKKEKKDTSVTKRGPIINVTDTIERKLTVLCIKDSAATAARLSTKLNAIYNIKLPDAIKTAKLKAVGPPMAWYRMQKTAFFFEAGIPVEKGPSKAAKGTFIKNTGKDSVLIAHFFGPTDLSAAGYDALNEILKDRNKKKSSPAYEIYVDNPFDLNAKKKDPYRMQMDIVVPYK
jgi:hypothetical protein